MRKASFELRLRYQQVTEASRCMSGFGIVGILIEDNRYLLVPKTTPKFLTFPFLDVSLGTFK